jgi:hypothetical protein
MYRMVLSIYYDEMSLSESTYWTKKDSDKAEIFLKIEPYLTFLNIPQLEQKGADIRSKVEELEELNQSFKKW